MKRRRRGTAKLLAALVILLAADGILFYIAGMPRIEDAAARGKWEGLDLLQKYRENHDMIGWLQVDGTNINYPVMRGEKYLNCDFSGQYDASGSLFTGEDWAMEDLCTLVHGHNMWMHGTMLHPLHKFADGVFFRRNRTIRFYVIKDGGRSAEKRTYEILCCSRASVDEWNYAGCQYICSAEELDAFAAECRKRAVQKRNAAVGHAGMIVLSTCSYHVRDGKGRLLVAGQLTETKEQTRIDRISASPPAKTD